MKEKLSLTKVDLFTVIASGLVCYFLLLGAPVWGIFFGMGWYAHEKGLIQNTYSMLASSVTAYVVCVALVVFVNIVNNIHVTVLAVGVATLIILMLNKCISISNVGIMFMSLSCFFACYYGHFYPTLFQGGYGDIVNISICAMWVLLANVIGFSVTATIRQLNNIKKG